MQGVHFFWSRGLCVALFLALGGCYTYKPLTIRVEDASTGAPLEHAHVVVGNGVYLNPFPPKASEGYTDKEGRIKLNFAYTGIPIARADKPGYSNSGNVGITREYHDAVPGHSLPELRIPLQKAPGTTNP